MNLVIEYDGIQHFKPIEYFGGDAAFERTIANDIIKNEYAKKNNINIVRIPYTKFSKIDDILNRTLNEYRKDNSKEIFDLGTE